MPRNKTSTGQKGPRFIQYFAPALEALKSLGGSGRPPEVEDYILKHYPALAGPEQMEILQTGVTRLNKDIHFARFYLVKDGLIASSQRGVWSLTERGAHAAVTPTAALEMFKRVHSQFGVRDGDDPPTVNPDAEAEAAPAEDLEAPPRNYREELMDLLKSLPPDGFERLCQRFLREAGFSQVEVRGRSGDGGIDGEGVLVVNALVSFKVLFQCKRYSGTVSSEVVRNFRGAMEGRSEKGIIITTSSFSREARLEATRDGARPIELVDGEKLAGMFEQLELGLTPVKTYEVNRSFFEAFR